MSLGWKLPPANVTTLRQIGDFHFPAPVKSTEVRNGKLFRRRGRHRLGCQTVMAGALLRLSDGVAEFCVGSEYRSEDGERVVPEPAGH